ncbi:thiol reductant ABC exporter subunit CydC [Brevibacterium casei]|uniref:ATP-binding/permease protein CydD n=1 Tax=Brevibacterium casei S18 TaxID=1229781 RepID=K9AP70_9MICO|nr:thiol reductant ABC exporter subunit CydC [Brevibacterium casei]EKU47811.1 ATP-binding/permease protein CydD [Brevibacterium casei S18]MBE4696063.1 thiol reductant ABC exporter subunit CydC [Brevibacterium casei]MBY3579185.1 thiol reductant ABC exporter subunit CydC [Brevibacterium casei]
MSSPLGILLSLPGGRRSLVLALTSAAVRAVGIVFIAEALVRTILDLGPVPLWVVLGVLGAALRGASLWADHSLGTAQSAAAKRGLRSRILGTLLRRPGQPRAKAAVTVTRGIDDLDDYFTTVVPALAQAAIVPAVLLVRIVFADVLSAIIIVLCLPLVPFFMILIGRYTEETTKQSIRALERLSDHLAELAEGLPVLIGLGRSREHARTLRRLSDDYHAASLTTLRVAFLSSLALELIATISVALVAVVIGVRLVSGSMELSDGLLALLLAPECFMPLRALGAGFHASENGRDAFDRAHTLLDDPDRTREDAVPGDRASASATGGDHRAVYADGTTITWADTMPTEPGITAVLGPSGAGKTTVLSALTGSLPEGAETTIASQPAALVPQSPRTFGATVGEELATFGLSDDDATAALREAGLPVDGDQATAALSPGQLRRLALVRLRARMREDADLLVLDEPTAHLDDDNAEIIIAMIAEAAEHTRVVLASHDPRVLALATDTITPVLGRAETAPATDGDRGRTGVPSASGAAKTASSHTAGPNTGTSADVASPPPSGAGPAGPATDTERTAERSAQARIDASSRTHGEPGTLRARWRTLRATLPLFTGTMAIALLTACAASLAAISLTAVSAWLIVEASYGPPIMTLLVAIVGVRFFGLCRSVLLYVSRLHLHSAVFGALGRLRSVLWTHFTQAGMSDRKMLSSDTALATMVADADEVRDLVPRTLFPPVVTALVVTAVIIAAAILDPASVPVIVVLGIINVIVVPLVFVRAEGVLANRIHVGRAMVLSLLTRALGAKADLRANGAEDAVLDRLAEAEDDLESAQKRSARHLGAAQLWIEASTVLAAIVIALTSGAPTEILAVVVLSTFGLADVFASALWAWRQMPALGIALDRLPPVTAAAESELAEADPAESEETEAHPAEAARTESDTWEPDRAPLTELELADVSVGWDGVPVLEDLALTADATAWTVVCGESGSGKTTTVSVLLRFLDPWSGTYSAEEGDGGRIDLLALGPEELSGRIAWCPQEAHVFRSTVRGNLALASRRVSDDEAMFSALRAAGLGHWATPAGLDRWVGDHGGEISGGERQRLAIARTLLTGAEVIVLDEPTAHLDEGTAHRLIDDLRTSLSDHTVIMVTHDHSLVAAGDRVEQLGTEVSPASIRT